MPRICPLVRYLALTVIFLLVGCSGSREPQKEGPGNEEARRDELQPRPISEVEKKQLQAMVAAELARQQPAILGAAVSVDAPSDQFNALLLQALLQRADGKHDQALGGLTQALTMASTAENKQLAQREIEREKALLAQQVAVERTLADIQTVLDQGKAAEASKLSTAALQQYGDTDTADRLVRLKQQSEALFAVQANDPGTQRARCRTQGDAALNDGNLRAAVVEYENALQVGEDAALRKQRDDLRTRLSRYDENRRRAAELRRDTGSLEDALAAYQDAAKAWDTPQVRQEIDECTLALQTRRERLSVTEFEVLGDVGMPYAGRRLAEELLPPFKTRFDLVEREQIGKLLDELKLQAGDLAGNDTGRQQLGQLARVRFLVLGNVSLNGCVTVNARLVDVRTGLIVQTGKVSAPMVEQLLPLLPDLARQLMMTDEQKMAYEQDLARRQTGAIAPIVVSEPLPPAPPLDALPAPAVVMTLAAPPVLGTVAVGDVRFPPPPPPGQAAQLAIAVEKEEPLRQRSVRLAVEVGDNLFRRGRYREAYTQFDLALSLSPGHRELELRVDRCRPCLPPPMPDTVLVPPPPRQRLAILDFVAEGRGRDLGAWAAENVAPAFCPTYDVVDRGAVYWYMGRLGLSLADVYRDPIARRWLGRALGVRYFVLGCISGRDALETTAHLVDAECGFEVGSGRVLAADAGQLRCVLPELARLTLMSPEERARYVRQQEQCRQLLEQARQCQERREFTVAITICEKAREICPRSVEVSVVRERNQDAARRAQWEAARRADEEQQRRAQAVEGQRQQELARQAEQARIQAEQQARAQADAVRYQLGVERQRAYEQLCAQAEAAFEARNYEVSAQLYQSAGSLLPNDACFRRLAEVRALQEQAHQTATGNQAVVVVGVRRVRQEEVARARTEIQQSETRVKAESRAASQAQDTRDQVEYGRLLDTAKLQAAQGKHTEAIGNLQTARRLRRTDEVDSLLSVELIVQARASEQSKNAQAVADLERRLAEEKQRRQQAEAEAKRKELLYQETLKQAQQARAAGQFDVAIGKSQAAIALYRTDAALSVLADAQQAKTRAEADQKERQAAAERKAKVGQLLAKGQQALQAGQTDTAISHLAEAKKLEPANVDVLAALGKAEVARDRAKAPARTNELVKAVPTPAAPPTRPSPAPPAVVKANPTPAALPTTPTKPVPGPTVAVPPVKPQPTPPLTAPVPAPTLPAKPNPTAPPTPPATAPTRSPSPPLAKPDQPSARPPVPKPSPEYSKQMQAGAVLLKQQKYTEAIKAYQEALKLQPGDPTATEALHKTEFDLHLADGQKAMTAKKYADAVKEFEAALKVSPTNAEAAALLKKAKEGKP